MKNLFRSIVLVLFVGGWGLASSAIYVIRTPAKFVIIPKDQLGFRDTYVDTRAWTIAEDREHPAVVARLLHLGKGEDLAHTVNTTLGPVDLQLNAAVASPTIANAQGDSASLLDKTKSEIKNLSDGVRAKLQ